MKCNTFQIIGFVSILRRAMIKPSRKIDTNSTKFSIDKSNTTIFSNSTKMKKLTAHLNKCAQNQHEIRSIGI